MIVSAAISHEGHVFSLPRPARHHDIIRLIHERTGQPVRGEEQGFLDDRGRFLRRKPAARVAVVCGQVKPEALLSSGMLFSEDLW